MKWLRGQVTNLQDRLFVEQGPEAMRLAARSANFQIENHAKFATPQLPPSIEEAIASVSTGDEMTFALTSWAANKLAEEDPEDAGFVEHVADLIFAGGDPLQGMES